MPSLARLATAVEERLLVPTYASRWTLAPIAAHRGMALPLQLRGPVSTLTADTEAGPVRITAAGRKKLLHPLVKRLFPHRTEWSAEPGRGLWHPRALAGLRADLVLAEVHRWLAPRFRREGWIIVPAAVRWTGDLATVPGPNPCHSLRSDLRKVRRAGFHLVRSDAAADWELFTDRMVAPQALARFGEDVWLPSPALLGQFRRAGTLLLVRLGDRPVAGVCALTTADSVWFPLSGVLDGDPDLFRSGVGLAILALGIEWARAQGCRRVDAGRTGPFLGDGVLRLKRKWGLAPVPDPLSRVVAVRALSPAADAAFTREPVLIETGDGLSEYHGALA